MSDPSQAGQIYQDKLRILKSQLNEHFRNLTSIGLSTPEAKRLKKKWADHTSTFGRIRWVLRQPLETGHSKYRYHTIVEYPCVTTGNHLLSCWMIDM